jgi:hypothetical protein
VRENVHPMDSLAKDLNRAFSDTSLEVYLEVRGETTLTKHSNYLLRRYELGGHQLKAILVHNHR